MESKHLQPLIWLRAIAAFLVVVSHTLRAAEVKYAANDEGGYVFPISVIDIGTFGVYLFFALSGCTLYLSSAGKIDSLKSFKYFYFKRFMRIWPAFAASLVIYIVFIEIFRLFYTSNTDLWIANFLNDYTVANVFQYLSLTFNLTGPDGLFVGPYWSLPVEFQYYLLLPFALFVMRSKGLNIMIPLVFGGGLYYIYQQSYFDVDRYEVFKMGYTFFGGVLLAVLHKKFDLTINIKISAIFFTLILVVVMMVRSNTIVIPENILFISDKWNFYGVFALISVALALCTQSSTKINPFINIVNKYGEISYSIYLFHMMFIGVAVLLVINFEIYGAHLKLAFILFFSVIGSYIFSLYSFKYLEKTSIDFSRSLIKRKV